MNWKLLCRGLATVWLVSWCFIAFMTYKPPFIAPENEIVQPSATAHLPPGYKLDPSLFSDAPSPEQLLQKKQVIGFFAIGVFGFAVMFVIAAACPATKR
jgi:hypothetical protein